MGDPFSSNSHLPFQNEMLNALRRQQGFLDEEQELLRQQRELVQKKQALNQRIIDELGREDTADTTPRGPPYPMSQQQPGMQSISRAQEGDASRTLGNTYRGFFGGQPRQHSELHVPQRMPIPPVAMSGSVGDPIPGLKSKLHEQNGTQNDDAASEDPKASDMASLTTAPALGGTNKRTASAAFSPPPAKTFTNFNPQPMQQNTYARYNEKYPTLAVVGKDMVEVSCYFCMGNHFRKDGGALQPIQGVRGMHAHVSACHQGDEAHDGTPRGYEWVAKNCVDKQLSKEDLEAVEKGEYAIRGVVEVSYGPNA